VRFARAYLRADNGELIAIGESEIPSDHVPAMRLVPNDGGPEIQVVVEELGLVDDFDPVELDGTACSPSRHLFLRVERDPAGGFRSKGGHELPPILDCPCTLEGLRQRLRERGLAGVPMKARAWLANVLPAHHVDALGLARGLPISALKAAEAIRNRRDPHAGSRMVVLERAAQEQADAHAASNLRSRRRAGERAARAAYQAAPPADIEPGDPSE
jgi:hypothetical protein